MKQPLSKIKRYWQNALAYALGSDKVRAGPISVHIETTNICNFRCIYCPQSQPDDHFSILGRGKMSLADYQQIINKILSAWPVRDIILTRDGEPLVHPELSGFIRYATDRKLSVTIGSNGSYFTGQKVKEIMDSGLKKVKGDFCSDKTTFEKLRAGGNWETVYQGYRNLLEYAVQNQLDFHLVLVDLATYELTEPAAVRESLDRLHDLFPYSDEYLSINPAMMHNAFDEAQVVLSTSDRLRKKKYNLCHHPWIELVIDYKGNAVGCCRDLRSEYIIGNVLKSDNIHEEIWNGPAMRHLRRQLARRSPESINTCSKCDLPYGVSYAGRGRVNKLVRYLRR